jgi:NAD(P)-dependent dehydrogenase (short-subunit alcohol dehydrogenase family)
MKRETILITGANREIGFALVKQYLKQGNEVLACCQDPSKALDLQNLIKEHGPNSAIYCLNVNNEANINALSAALRDKPIDILINNAGIWGPRNATFDSVNTHEWLEVFMTNSVAPVLVSRAFIPNLVHGHRKIIANISSILGSITLNNSEEDFIYKSSKAALNTVTKSLSYALKSQDIIVTALHPGWVKTDMGGPNATLNAKDSARYLSEVIGTLTPENSGEFISYDKTRLPW